MRFVPTSRVRGFWSSARRAVSASRRLAKQAATAVAPIESLEPRALLSSYYVSTSGNDSNTGTLSQPFRTIQAAAERAEPGDTVYIRGGTYRETVRPSRSGKSGDPIVFAAYGNERVTVSGADVIGGWSNHDDKVYRARQSWDLGFGNNQIFVDGRMMIEARWPNTTLDLARPSKAEADSIDADNNGARSSAVLRDSALTHPDGYWDGATIHIIPGHGWVGQTGTVTDYSRGRLTYRYQEMNARYETPEDHDRYYLTGKFQALDAAGEWFRDDNGSLYLWTPQGDSPAKHTVEAKRRDFAFDLRGRSHVHVQGLDLFAATVGTDGSSDSIRLSGLDVKYVSHYTVMPTGWSRPDATGILLLGTNSVLRDSTIAYSAGYGVALAGEDNRVEDVVVYGANYNVGNHPGINARGSGHVITRNTIYDCARDGIKVSRATDVKVTHNLIHDVMLQTTDGGGIYTYGTDGNGSEFAYNKIYNVRSGGFGAVGIYLDNFSSNYVVHHNAVWDSTHAMKLNPTSRDHLIYNNTLVGERFSVETSKSGDMLGSVFRNNIFTKGARIDPRATKSNNLAAGTDPKFVDLSDGDLRLRSNSPAIDAGRYVDDPNDNYTGDAPDLGAFEYGRTAWTAGARVGASRPEPQKPTEPTDPPSEPTDPPSNPTAKRDADETTQAESYDGTDGAQKGRTIIGHLHAGDWVRYDGVNFANGALRTFRVRMGVADGWDGKKIEIRLGSATGRLVGTLSTRSTGGWDKMREQTTTISGVTGVHNLYLVFTGGDGVGVIDSFRFSS